MSVNFPMKLLIVAYFSCERHISVATKPNMPGQNGLDFQNQSEKNSPETCAHSLITFWSKKKCRPV